MGKKESIQFTGGNDDKVFDFARPFVFRDYTDPKVPMKLRSPAGLFKRVLAVGDWIVKQADGSFVAQKGAPNEIRG